MKRIITVMLMFSASIAANAQSSYDPMRDGGYVRELTHVLAVLTAFFILSTFLLTLIKLFFDHRVKNKMIDRGVGENVVSQLLNTDRKEGSHAAIKWFIIFAGIGLGLTLIDVFQPFGIHSLAIMAFCIAAGFLAYYYFVRRSEKQ